LLDAAATARASAVSAARLHSEADAINAATLAAGGGGRGDAANIIAADAAHAAFDAAADAAAKDDAQEAATARPATVLRSEVDARPDVAAQLRSESDAFDAATIATGGGGNGIPPALAQAVAENLIGNARKVRPKRIIAPTLRMTRSQLTKVTVRVYVISCSTMNFIHHYYFTDVFPLIPPLLNRFLFPMDFKRPLVTTF
jgi:hypothetical protein